MAGVGVGDFESLIYFSPDFLTRLVFAKYQVSYSNDDFREGSTNSKRRIRKIWSIILTGICVLVGGGRRVDDIMPTTRKFHE